MSSRTPRRRSSCPPEREGERESGSEVMASQRRLPSPVQKTCSSKASKGPPPNESSRNLYQEPHGSKNTDEESREERRVSFHLSGGPPPPKQRTTRRPAGCVRQNCSEVAPDGTGRRGQPRGGGAGGGQEPQPTRHPRTFWAMCSSSSAVSSLWRASLRMSMLP